MGVLVVVMALSNREVRWSHMMSHIAALNQEFDDLANAARISGHGSEDAENTHPYSNKIPFPLSFMQSIT
jgi:hypothetical protein